ncbi:hypothetical protein ZHAS_00016462 [Anopheles sinensis]|uniref:Uncharacterized protein n=1 Tax=Anopheles sinensis TaxID=74873 RepID=A0A084WDQ9_ANOSI|nr:hypothetical protein ZHAS_00016462 [Anopheles sinensis]
MPLSVVRPRIAGGVPQSLNRKERQFGEALKSHPAVTNFVGGISLLAKHPSSNNNNNSNSNKPFKPVPIPVLIVAPRMRPFVRAALQCKRLEGTERTSASVGVIRACAEWDG